MKYQFLPASRCLAKGLSLLVLSGLILGISACSKNDVGENAGSYTPLQDGQQTESGLHARGTGEPGPAKPQRSLQADATAVQQVDGTNSDVNASPQLTPTKPSVQQPRQSVSDLKKQLTELNQSGAVSDRSPQASTQVLIPRTASAYLVAGIGRNLNQAAAGVATARRLSEKGNRDGTERMALVRQQFWERFPDGEGFAEVEKLFASELFKKDVAMALQRGTIRMTRSSNSGVPAALGGSKFDLSRLTGKMLDSIKNYDGGIAPGSRRAFDQWIESAFPTADRMTFSSALSISDAFTKHSDGYESYLLARNRYEYWRAGKEDLFFPTSDSFVAYMHQTGWVSGYSSTLEQAIVWAEGLKRDFGTDAYENAVKILREAAKTEHGSLTEEASESLGLSTQRLKEALLKLLGRTNLENYAISLLYDGPEPKKRLEKLYKQYGRKKTLESARLVKDAPRTTGKRGREFLQVGPLESVGARRSSSFAGAFLNILDFEDRQKQENELDKSIAASAFKLAGVPSRIDGRVLNELALTKGRLAVSKSGKILLLKYDRDLSKLELLVVTTKPTWKVTAIDVTPRPHKMPRRNRRETRKWYPVRFVLSRSTVSPSRHDDVAIIKFPSYSTDETPSVGAIKVVDLKTGDVSQEIIGAIYRGRGVGFGGTVALGENYFAVSAPRFDNDTQQRRGSEKGRVYVYQVGKTEASYTIDPLPSDKGSEEYSHLEFGQYLAIVGDSLMVQFGSSSKWNQRPLAAVYNLKTGKRISTIKVDEQSSSSNQGGQRLLCNETQAFIKLGTRIAPVDLSTGAILEAEGFELADDLTVAGITGENLVVYKEKQDSVYKSADLINANTGEQVGQVSLRGKAVAGNGRRTPVGTPVDIPPSYLTGGFVGNGFLAFPGYDYTTGHVVWYARIGEQ